MKKEMRKELCVGVVLNAIFFALIVVFSVPSLILGVVFSLGICFTIIGILPEHAYTNLKNRKKSLFQGNAK